MTTVFKLGTFNDSGEVFAGLVLDEQVYDLRIINDRLSAGRTKRLLRPDRVQGLLEDWDRNFEILCRLAESVTKEVDLGARALGSLPVLPPVLRPSKMLYAGANYADHVAEMRGSNFDGGMSFEASKDFMGEKAKTKPYSFLKPASCLAGAYDDIVLPWDHTEYDWEVELALAIGRPGRRIPAERAMEHVAGFMTTNDVSCRDAQWRPDRQTLRSDWIGGKCYDTFAPMGPFLVPRAFVPNYMNLRLKLAVNGEVMQDGSTAGLIFTPEEQIEYFSRAMTLESGDVFATGTPGGVGQGRGRFLKPGDVIECEVEGLGRQRNRCVPEAH